MVDGAVVDAPSARRQWSVSPVVVAVSVSPAAPARWCRGAADRSTPRSASFGADGGLRDVLVLRHDGDREHHAVVREAEVVEVGDVVDERRSDRRSLFHTRTRIWVSLPLHLKRLGVALARLAGAHLARRELEHGVGELDVVDVEEHAELGPVAGGPAGLRVVVDDAVGVAVPVLHLGRGRRCWRPWSSLGRRAGERRAACSSQTWKP